MLEVLFLISIPFISAFIGWLTNYFAIKTLFHPKKPVNLILFQLHGIFPKRQEALAKRLGEVISEGIISTDDIVDRFVKNSNLNNDLRKVTEDYLDNFIQNRLLAKIPMASMFVNDSLIGTLKESFFEDWDKIMDELKITIRQRMQSEVNIKVMIEEKVSKFSTDQLEEILVSILQREFRFIERIGGVIGFIIGCVQLVFVWLYTTF